MKKQTISILLLSILVLLNIDAMAQLRTFDDGAANSLMDTVLRYLKPVLIITAFGCIVVAGIKASGGEKGREEAKGWAIGSVILFIIVALAKPFANALGGLF